MVASSASTETCPDLVPRFNPHGLWGVTPPFAHRFVHVGTARVSAFSASLSAAMLILFLIQVPAILALMFLVEVDSLILDPECMALPNTDCYLSANVSPQ